MKGIMHRSDQVPTRAVTAETIMRKPSFRCGFNDRRTAAKRDTSGAVVKLSPADNDGLAAIAVEVKHWHDRIKNLESQIQIPAVRRIILEIEFFVGGLLHRAKKQLGRRGEWLRWLDKFGINRRTAQTHMRCRNHRIAIHEAGHAVVCRALNIPVKFVTVVSDGQNPGCVVDAPADVSKNIISAMAGAVAERLTIGARRRLFNSVSHSGDRAQIKEFIAVARSQKFWMSAIPNDWLSPQDRLRADEKRYRQAMRQRCEKLVRQHRASIKAVARGLLQFKTLTGSDMNIIIAFSRCRHLDPRAAPGKAAKGPSRDRPRPRHANR
jgi:hypothetical protein